jgi:hypothetical protein
MQSDSREGFFMKMKRILAIPVALLGCQRSLGLGDGWKGIHNWLQPSIQRVPT